MWMAKNFAAFIMLIGVSVNLYGHENVSHTDDTHRLWISSFASFEPEGSFDSIASPGMPYPGALVEVTVSHLSESKKYVCAPCGCDSDAMIFDKPGTCPSCGMELIEKSPEEAQKGNTPESTTAIIKSAWMLEVPPTQRNSAAYMVIENQASTEMVLTSASSEIAAAVELHTMETDSSGMMRMRKTDRITVPAKGSIELKPGGLHLMFIGLRREIKEGEEVTVTLFFSDSVKKTITLPVKRRV